MKLDKVRRLAVEVLGVGKQRIWIDPEQRDRAKEAMTKDDVRALIKEGVIKKRPEEGQSRSRARTLALKKRKGRKRGKGKKTGTKKARSKIKKRRMESVRAQRRKLKELRQKNPEAVEKIGYRVLYRKIKGGFFKGKKQVEIAVLGGK